MVAKIKSSHQLKKLMPWFVWGVLGWSTCVAQAASLMMGLSGDVTSIDPHFHNVTPNTNASEHIFDTLIAKDEKMRLKPALALSWKVMDDFTWELKLRSGVKFHDGSDFTAEDAVFSLTRPALVKNSPGPFTIYTKAIKEAVALDKTTLRIKTHVPYPMLPNDVSTIYMVSKKVAENATSEDFNNGKASVGTGPYKFVAFKKGDRIELARNNAWWGGKTPWEKATLRMLTSDAARVAALLSGDVQVIENVPTPDIKRLESNPNVVVNKAITFRMMYLHMDSARDKTPFVTDKTGKPLEKNPFKDLRVRQAISKAISRTAIANRVMEDTAEPTGQLVMRNLFGHNPALKPDVYDPNIARKLLSEAGYPDGFSLTLHATNNRYVNDDQVAQVLASMLARIGIAVKVDAMPSSVFFTRANKLDFSFYLAGWGSDTGEGASSLKALLATYDANKGMGVANRGRYSNPKMDALLAQALQTLDDNKREKLVQEATKMAMDDLGVIPLYDQINVWATRKGLLFTPRVDERTHAWEVRVK